MRYEIALHKSDDGYSELVLGLRAKAYDFTFAITAV